MPEWEPSEFSSGESERPKDKFERLDDYVVREVDPTDLVVVDAEGHGALLPIGPWEVMLVYSPSNTDEQLLQYINALRHGGFPGVRILAVGEQKKAIEYYAGEKGHLVLKDAPVGQFFSKEFRITGLKVDDDSIDLDE